MKIYCCQCEQDVNAMLVTGRTVYPHRPDLAALSFYQCPYCENFVGTHKATRPDQSIRPLGCIATQELKNARIALHEVLDPLWKQYGIKRQALYADISKRLGYEYHTANTKTIDEINKVREIVKDIYAELQEGTL